MYQSRNKHLSNLKQQKEKRSSRKSNTSTNISKSSRNTTSMSVNTRQIRQNNESITHKNNNSTHESQLNKGSSNNSMIFDFSYRPRGIIYDPNWSEEKKMFLDHVHGKEIRFSFDQFDREMNWERGTAWEFYYECFWEKTIIPSAFHWISVPIHEAVLRERQAL